MAAAWRSAGALRSRTRRRVRMVEVAPVSLVSRAKGCVRLPGPLRIQRYIKRSEVVALAGIIQTSQGLATRGAAPSAGGTGE